MTTSTSEQKTKPNSRNASTKRDFDLSKYIHDAQIGDLKLEAVLEGGSKNMQAIVAANKAITEGYADVAKRQYEILRELLEEAITISGRKSKKAKELKQLVKYARKDLQGLLKMARKANAEAQKIISKRTDANIKAWKKLIKGTSKTASGNEPVNETKPTAKASVTKKPVARKPAAKKVTAKKSANSRTTTKADRTVGVTQAAVLAAIRAGHSTPKDIANAMKANPVQVNKALSRYTRQGIIVRTQPGQYAL